VDRLVSALEALALRTSTPDELQAYVRATLRAACVFADTSLGPLPVQVVALVTNELSRHSGSRYATLFFAEYDTSHK
jgi:hypothetical protein